MASSREGERRTAARSAAAARNGAARSIGTRVHVQGFAAIRYKRFAVVRYNASPTTAGRE